MDSIIRLIHSKWNIYILLLISFAVYANTLFHDFTLDDKVVFTENKFVQKGVSGIPSIITNETFAGYFKDSGRKSTVSGGRYRPLTLCFFAIENQLTPNNAFVAHLINILFFCLLTGILFMTLSKLLSFKYPTKNILIAFVASLLFIVHPIHTEVVANIKGLDEIWSLLFSFIALFFILKQTDTKKTIHTVFAGIFFTLALFSKENAIVFLVLIPLGLWLLSSETRNAFKSFIPLSLASVFFLVCRIAVTGSDFITNSKNFLENPFLQFRGERLVEMNVADKYGTIFYTLLKYVQLHFIPYPLTHDYAPKSIATHQMFTPLPMLALLLSIAAIVFAVIWRKSKPIYSWSLCVFMIALLPTSNLFFTIGAYMGERFVFTSSIGFCLMLGAFFVNYLMPKYKWSFFLLLGMVLAFSVRTVSRNLDWKDNLTLFNADYPHSSNSAKLNSSLGFSLLEKYRKSEDKENNKHLLTQAVFHLNKALEIYPKYLDCLYLLGNANYLSKDYKNAVSNYENYIQMNPADVSIMKNYQKALREYGRILFHEEHNNAEAKQVLIKSLKLNADDDQALELLGSAEAELGYLLKSLQYLLKAAEINPNSASIWANLYITYTRIGDKANAQIAINKGMEIDKDVVKKLMSVKMKDAGGNLPTAK